MRNLPRILGAFAVAASAAGAAIAADAGPILMPMAVPPPPPIATESFRWDGWHFGAYGATEVPLSSSLAGVVGGVIGYEFTWDRYLAGVSIAAHWGFGRYNRTDMQINARVGGLLAERVLLYGRVGVGVGRHIVPSSTLYLYYGGGVEFALLRQLSVFAEIGQLAGLSGGGTSPWAAVIGLNWRPKR